MGHSYTLAEDAEGYGEYVEKREPRLCGECSKRSVIKDDDYLCPVCRLNKNS